LPPESDEDPVGEVTQEYAMFVGSPSGSGSAFRSRCMCLPGIDLGTRLSKPLSMRRGVRQRHLIKRYLILIKRLVGEREVLLRLTS
jgi:hypothetical protein